MKTIRLSNIVGKKVIVLSTACVAGIITGVNFDKQLKKAKNLIVQSIDTNQVEKKYIDIKHVCHMNNDAITIKFESDITFEWNTKSKDCHCPLNACVYTHTGQLVGKLTDIHFEHYNDNKNNNNIVSNRINTTANNNNKLKNAKSQDCVQCIEIDFVKQEQIYIISYSQQIVIISQNGKKPNLKQKKIAIPKSTTIKDTKNLPVHIH